MVTISIINYNISEADRSLANIIIFPAIGPYFWYHNILKIYFLLLSGSAILNLITYCSSHSISLKNNISNISLKQSGNDYIIRNQMVIIS